MSNAGWLNEDGTWNRDHAHKYTKILELDKLLTENNIPHVLQEYMDGWIIYYPEDGPDRLGDVIEHHMSYDLEAQGFDFPTVEGNLTVEQAYTCFAETHRVEQIRKKR